MGGIMKKVKDKLNELEISNSKMKFKWAGALKNLKSSYKLQHLIFDFLSKKYYKKNKKNISKKINK